MELRKTHLYEFHKEHGNVIDFGGFAMPVWYEGIISEHNAVREHCGIFDTSHMGRVYVTGEDAERYLNYMVTNNVSRLKEGGGLYSVMCRPNGGIVDDLILYKMGPERYLVVYNASNRKKDFNWLQENTKGFDVELEDVSDEIAMVAIQGPKAEEILQSITDEDLSEISRFHIKKLKIDGYDGLAARTGYTGEDGFEFFVPDCPKDTCDKALKIWNKLVEEGAVPCGLGARDSLRLEAGLSLYGNDIDESINPLEAGLGWVVKFKKPGYFIGQRALQENKEKGVDKKLVGIKMIDRGIPRHGYEIVNQDEDPIGAVTSGVMSPTLGVGIAMGYVPPEYTEIGAEVGIKIRGRIAKGKIVKHHPFYDESEYGIKRES
ncbi:MAG: glycine cleavage system aminomethyltransferase GcvT [Candidatus Bathyarchaeia archaeon]